MGNFALIIFGTIAVVWYAVSNDAQTLNQVITSAEQDQTLIGFALLIAVQPVFLIIFLVLRKRQRDGKL